MLNERIDGYAAFSKGFRGLPDGWHNLLACNFLVGQNSSGKSSFLQLIEILDSREHILLLDIEGIVEGLDTPSDICSRASGCNEVTIGFFVRGSSDHTTARKRPTVTGRLATYKKTKEGMQLTRLTVLSDTKVLRLKRQGKRLYRRIHYARYNTDETHVENANRLERLHFASNIRFRSSREVAWADYMDGVIWHQEVAAITASQANRRSDSFQAAGPSLNALHYGPMRAKTKRLYHGANNSFSASGEHIAYMLKEVLKNDGELRASIQKFGRSSGLYDEISITSVSTAVKDRPFTLQIKKGDAYYYVDELGYGVGQALPIVADLCYATGANSFMIQQPELHLHPKAQSALGEVFYSAMRRGSVLIVETHSDFIIDRFRMAFRKGRTNHSAQVIYFDSGSDGLNAAHEIEILRDGTLKNIPDGYRSFFVDEAIEKFESLA